MADFEWDERRSEAARFLGETSMPVSHVAAELGINKDTLNRWRLDADFLARVAEHEAKVLQEAARSVYARRFQRIMALSAHAMQMEAVMKSRAEREFETDWMNDQYRASGGGSGLMAWEKKVGGSGPYTEVWYEAVFDAPLSKAYRDTLKQLSEEVRLFEEEGGEIPGDIIIQFKERTDGPQ